MNCRRTFFVCVLTALLMLPALADNLGFSDSSFKQDMLKQQVLLLLNKLRAIDGDDGGYELRMDLVAKGQAVLPLLRPYVDDPNSSVRFAVITVAERLPSEEATQIIISFVASSDISLAKEAINHINQFLLGNNGIRVRDLNETDKGRLINNLIVTLKRWPASPETMLLLSGLSRDNSTLLFLHKLRDANLSATFNYRLQERDADLSLLIDLVLVRLGEKDAVKRVLDTIHAGKISDLVLVCDLADYVDDQSILLALVGLLQDKRESNLPPLTASDGPQDPSIPPNVRERVCDIALVSLKTKANIDLGLPRAARAYFPVFQYVHFTDEELAQAQSLLQKHFASSLY